MDFSKVSELTIKGKTVRSLSKDGKEFWGRHHLPSIYQEAEYLEGTGTQAIDTDLTFPDVDAFKIMASFNSVSDNQGREPEEVGNARLAGIPKRKYP